MIESMRADVIQHNQEESSSISNTHHSRSIAEVVVVDGVSRFQSQAQRATLCYSFIGKVEKLRRLSRWRTRTLVGVIPLKIILSGQPRDENLVLRKRSGCYLPYPNNASPLLPRTDRHLNRTFSHPG
jgi:hypothetical protein